MDVLFYFFFSRGEEMRVNRSVCPLFTLERASLCDITVLPSLQAIRSYFKKRAEASMGESHNDPVGVDASTMPMTSQHAASSDVAYASLLVRGPAGSGEV